MINRSLKQQKSKLQKKNI